ncbi:hypothetical protein BH10ACT7_BH10ACT7_10920 [soil metagenome]
MTLTDSRRRVSLMAAISVVIGATGAIVIAAPASASTFTVDSLTDNGVGYTLREAISDANAIPGADTITFLDSLANGTLSINSALTITQSLTITGLGSGSLSIQRTVDSNVFSFAPTSANQDFALTGITVQGNDTLVGSGLVVGTGSSTPRNVTVSGVRFVDMNSTTGGSGLNVTAMTGTLNVSGSTFHSGSAGASGGGLSALGVGAAVTLTNNTFYGNSAAVVGGGAVLSSPAAVVTVTNCTFELNSSTQAGAGLGVTTSAGTTVTGSTFRTNTAGLGGGGMYVAASTFASVSDTIFDRNEAPNNRGGGLAASFMSGLVTVTNVTFTNNIANVGGGLATLDGMPLTVTGSTFVGNMSGKEGGAIHLTDPGDTSITGGELRGNSAFGSGGAIYTTILDHKLTIMATTIEANTSNNGSPGGIGGGIGINGVNAGGVLTIDSSTFTGNAVNTGSLANGGGVSIGVANVASGGVVSVLNSTFSELWPGAPGAVFVQANSVGGTLDVDYATIVADSGLRIGSNGGDTNVTSTLIDGDPLDTGTKAIRVDAGSPVGVEWSILSSALDATVADNGGNQFAVSNFKLGALANNGGPTRTMLPLAGSPAIDQGNPAVTGEPTFDQRGTGFPRIVGGRIDIGAVEAPRMIAATGTSINPAIPTAGGVLLVLGAGAVILANRRRRQKSL